MKDITGILVAASGNVKAQVDMACVDSYAVDVEAGTKQLLNHFAIATGAVVKDQVVALSVTKDSSVEVLDLQFVTAPSDANLESGTNDPIVMVLGYTDRRGVQRELVLPDLRRFVISEGAAFSTDSVTQVRLLLRDIVSVQTLQLMPYNVDPMITAGWKPSQITLSLGADGSLQTVTRTLDTYIFEDVELNPNGTITGEMVGGLKINLSNIILSADVAATNEAGYYGNSYRINSAANHTLSMTVSSEATVRFHVTVSNSKQGFAVKAEQSDGMRDISGLVTGTAEGFTLTMPENVSGEDQIYRITVSSKENENIVLIVDVTVKSAPVPEEPEVTEPSEPTKPSEPTEPSVPTEPTEPSVPTEPSEPTEPSVPTEPSEPTEPAAPTEPSKATEPSESTEPTEGTA